MKSFRGLALVLASLCPRPAAAKARPLALHPHQLISDGLGHGQSVNPTFYGAVGSPALTNGKQSVATSGAQLSGAVMTAGSQVISSGFLSFIGDIVSQVVNNNLSTTQTASTPTGPVTLVIPAGAYPSGTVVSVQDPTAVPATNDPLLSAVVGSAIEIESGGVQPAKPALLTISYATAVLKKDQNPKFFTLARYNPKNGHWVALESHLDEAKKTVSSSIDHFSMFMILVSHPSTTVEAAKVFPNPFRPAMGQRRVSIINLPAHARVRLYTLTGELVKDMDADIKGEIFWDGTNQSGRHVASGVYFGYAEGNETKMTFKVAVQR
jgi:hypothetical protein